MTTILERRRLQLEQSRENMKRYLLDKAHDEDWHGVMDAAADLREIDAEFRALGVKLQ